MIILIIGSLLLGAILGRFFNVLVLAPAFALSLAMVVASFAYFGHGLLRALLEFAVLITSLQIGYVSGVCFWRNAGQPWPRPRRSVSGPWLGQPGAGQTRRTGRSFRSAAPRRPAGDEAKKPASGGAAPRHRGALGRRVESGT